ncbi:hypothetical protein FB451DRAFT_1518118 [Mycena latifolia]|nr:hypothetical protein FB451DRAFT_1518118 [Mycena latifolia]
MEVEQVDLNSRIESLQSVFAQETDPLVLYHPTTLAPIFPSGAQFIQHLYSRNTGLHNRSQEGAFQSTTIAQIQDKLLTHHNFVVRRSIAQNLHYFETVEAFPQILLLHQTVAEAGIEPDSHIYVRFPLRGGAGSRDNPDPQLILTGRRQRKQAPTLSDPNNGETEIAAMEALVDRIGSLTRQLPSSIPIATRESKIATAIVLLGQDGGAASTFNRRMDILFGEELRDDRGRLKYVEGGKYGMGAVVKYLKTVPWAELESSLVRPKLDRLIRELELLCSTSSASSNPNSKRKSPDPTSDAEDPPDAKRIRSTKDGSVIVHEVPDEDDRDFEPDVDNGHRQKSGPVGVASAIVWER